LLQKLHSDLDNRRIFIGTKESQFGEKATIRDVNPVVVLMSLPPHPANKFTL